MLEAKQGSHEGSHRIGVADRNTPRWQIAMQDAFGQALKYARHIDDNPPFVVVTDVGYCFDTYGVLRNLFVDPYALDPTRRAARVTREIAAQVADIARQLEAAGHDAERVAKFLMRCLFTMFAEDVHLLRERIFSNAFDRWVDDPAVFPSEVEDLWAKMDSGGTLWGGGRIWRFNGGLFADPFGLPLDRQQLQWQVRTKGFEHPDEPILRDYHNIECRDALLAHDGKIPLFDDDSKPVTRWDGVTMKRHPVTGEDVPDDAARVPVYRYVNPRKAEWPEAEFIVGNPPFLGKSFFIEAFGDEYTSALRNVHTDVPDSADLVMYWWARAAKIVGSGQARRFGLVTTNSITQIFNRRVVTSSLRSDAPIHIAFAIPDHPWVRANDGAAVGIAMTVGGGGLGGGIVATVIGHAPSESDDGTVDVVLQQRSGEILDDLTTGPAVVSAVSLLANRELTSAGVMLGGRGFIAPSGNEIPNEGVLKRIINGRDLLQRSSRRLVIDCYGLSAEEMRTRAPYAFQRLLDAVKPERDRNRRASRRERWWLFSEVMPQMRRIIAGLPRFIVTPETAKHRVFFFLEPDVVPEHPLLAIGLADAYYFGVLSSRIHVVWALATGGTLEDRPRYNKTVCFERFPFPAESSTRAEFVTRANRCRGTARSGRRFIPT